MNNDILKKAEMIAKEEASKLGLEILEVSYVKEHGIKILRIIAEKDDGLNIDDSSNLNMAISSRLDEVDLIDEEYYLEVSSAGIERELKSTTDINNALGKYIYIKLFEKVDGQKEIYGDLIEVHDNQLVIASKIKGQPKTFDIDRNKISKIRLAVKF